MARKSRQRELLPRARVSQRLVIEFAVKWGIAPQEASRLCKAAQALEAAGFTVSK